jgi:hypothetical protein
MPKSHCSLLCKVTPLAHTISLTYPAPGFAPVPSPSLRRRSPSPLLSVEPLLPVSSVLQANPRYVSSSPLPSPARVLIICPSLLFPFFSPLCLNQVYCRHQAEDRVQQTTRLVPAIFQPPPLPGDGGSPDTPYRTLLMQAPLVNHVNYASWLSPNNPISNKVCHLPFMIFFGLRLQLCIKFCIIFA